MSFAVTITGTMKGVVETTLKNSEGATLFCSLGGTTISWLTDTQFQIVLPTNENIGTKILWVMPNYFSKLWTQVGNFTQTSYEIDIWMEPKGTVVRGTVTESVSNALILDVTTTITPGSYSFIPETLNKNFYTVIYEAGTWESSFSKSGYSSTKLSFVTEQVTLENLNKTINLHPNLTLISGEYFGTISGNVLAGRKDAPCFGVDVSITNLSTSNVIRTRTDKNGDYSIYAPVGNYTILFSKIGYESQSGRVTITAGVTRYFSAYLPKTFPSIEGNISYLSAYTEGSDLQIILKRDDGQEVDRLFKTAGDTTYIFSGIQFIGRYRILAKTALLEAGIQLFFRTPYFSLKDRQEKIIDLALDKKNTGYSFSSKTLPESVSPIDEMVASNSTEVAL